MVFEVVIDEQHYGKESIDKASRTIESAGAAGDVRWLQPLSRARVGNARLRGFFLGRQWQPLFLGTPTFGWSGCMRWWRASGASPTSPTFRSLPTPTPVTATR